MRASIPRPGRAWNLSMGRSGSPRLSALCTIASPKRVFGALLRGGGELEQGILFHAVCQDDIRDNRRALGDRARLVQDDGLDPVRLFQRGAALDEDPALGAPARSRP